MKKILFISEATTLAHIGRPIALAQELDSSRCRVEIACDKRYRSHVQGADFPWQELPSISPEKFMGALRRGAPLYDASTLESYVESDVTVLRRLKPDVVIGDFRLSLSISARKVGVPYVALSNAYWSPHFNPRYTVPALPHTRFLPIALAQTLFSLARPIAFAIHSVPLNSVRKKHGMSSLGTDLRRVYTDADQVWYADSATLYPNLKLPENECLIGPVIWVPAVSLPDWWHRIPADARVVYVTLGSSGDPELVRGIVEVLDRMGFTAVVASLGSAAAMPSASAWVADLLPGGQMAARSQLVICNGGSPTTHQALREGTPVIGICGNLDQYLNMSVLESRGLGKVLRSDRLGARRVEAAIDAVISSSAMKRAAEEAGRDFGRAIEQRRLKITERLENL